MTTCGTLTASAHLLPADSVLLPLADGQLLVSPSHALFCRVPSSAVEATRAAIANPRSEANLPPEFVELLTQHGFGGPPRPSPPAAPSVQLQLTNACNLTCAYCCTDSGAPRAREVTLDQLLRVVDEARQTLGPTTRFGILGGNGPQSISSPRLTHEASRLRAIALAWASCETPRLAGETDRMPIPATRCQQAQGH